MKKLYTVREKANEYTKNELVTTIELKEKMIESFQIDGLNKNSAHWAMLPDYYLDCAKSRFKNSIIELKNLKRILNYKIEMQNIHKKYPKLSEENAYFLWSFSKRDDELFLEQS